ncbi:hypothetical protein BO82DRAFT_199145 [Aspergillus uvarum CBS 121591]|uniref:Uncharacterized protein n=1 Tax=Aspergillus uvarum CBS 121591 TaxID=1448315 RepID=A0A319CGW3_9EURO|nr:hypothetical protein BO82DRAFT_199145 [Aspergillus uvarum CBS 121591]PYH85086.1 hypothetical protein BO82DRAFT_199145 [Aspergillus uvarum CBS 121591]
MGGRMRFCWICPGPCMLAENAANAISGVVCRMRLPRRKFMHHCQSAKDEQVPSTVPPASSLHGGANIYSTVLTFSKGKKHTKQRDNCRHCRAGRSWSVASPGKVQVKKSSMIGRAI